MGMIDRIIGLGRMALGAAATNFIFKTAPGFPNDPASPAQPLIRTET